ncbi:outer membrane beta-barrel protein [Roseivirga pacifica]
MKKLYRIFAIVILCAGLFSTTDAKAQYQASYLHIDYAPVIGLGETADYAGGFSFNGFSAGYRFFISTNISVGLESGWQVMREESDGIVTEVIETEDNTLTLSAKQFRFINSTPVLATGHYYFGSEYSVRPYVGLGVGGYYIARRTEMGLYAFEDNNFHFGLAPAAGVIVPFQGDVSGHFGVKYNYATKAGDSANVNYLGFSIGVGFGL